MAEHDRAAHRVLQLDLGGAGAAGLERRSGDLPFQRAPADERRSLDTSARSAMGRDAGRRGAYWAIANWYVPAPSLGLPSMKSSLIQVNPGDVLQGVMTCTSQTGSEFSYVSSFVGYPSIDLTVTDVDELQWSFETLECYGLTQCSDYPASRPHRLLRRRGEGPGPPAAPVAPTPPLIWPGPDQLHRLRPELHRWSATIRQAEPSTCITASRPRDFYFVNDKSSFGKDEVARCHRR